MSRLIIFYSICLAFLAFILKTIEYKWLMKEISWPLFILFIATIFGFMGAWLARQFLSQSEKQPFCQNQQAIKNLRLSVRELEVLEEVNKGYSNKEIAAQLFISTNTVKTHLKHAFDKLEVSNRILAIEKLKSLKIIEK